MQEKQRILPVALQQAVAVSKRQQVFSVVKNVADAGFLKVLVSVAQERRRILPVALQQAVAVTQQSRDNFELDQQ